MKELKTLMDITTPYPYYNGDEDEFKRVLKSEAIKWVKDIRQKLKGNPDLLNLSWFAIHFFNLTSEDLQ